MLALGFGSGPMSKSPFVIPLMLSATSDRGKGAVAFYFAYICIIWTTKPSGFTLKPIHEILGLNILGARSGFFRYS